MQPSLAWKAFVVETAQGPVLRLDDLTIPGPGLVLILGGTGSGKTTLLRSATGHAVALEGRTRRGTAPPATHTAYLPQDPVDAFLSADLSAELHVRAAGRHDNRHAARAWARAETSRLVAAGHPSAPFAALSAGQRHRLALAVVQTHDPHLLLLDEPFTHCDEATRRSLVAQIVRDAQSRLVLVATHDPAPLLPHAQRVIALRAGHVIFDGPPSVFFPKADQFPEVLLHPRPPPLPPARSSSGPRVVLEDATIHVGNRLLLQHLNATFPPGLNRLDGRNGIGKTTLLKAIHGFDNFHAGVIDVAHGAPDGRRSALLVEEPTTAFFAPTVREELAFGLRNETGCDVNARVREALSDFDLEPLAGRHPYSLSGGESTRLALACIDAMRRPVILLDEPAQGLDGEGRRVLDAYLHRARQDHCIILASHEPGVAANADHVFRLDEAGLHQVPEVPPRTS